MRARPVPRGPGIFWKLLSACVEKRPVARFDRISRL